MKNPQPLIKAVLKNLVICLMIIIAGIFLIYLIGAKIEDNFWSRTDISYLLSQKNLTAARYDKLVAGGGYDFSGYFEIVDSEGHVLYCSEAEKHNTYNAQALTFIPDSKAGESFNMEKISGKRRSQFLLTRYETVDGESQLAGIMFIAADGTITQSSFKIGTNHLDAKTLHILKKNTDRRFLQKHRFTTNDGKVRYLLYHVGNRNKLSNALEDKVWNVCTAASILLAVFSVIGFCIQTVKEQLAENEARRQQAEAQRQQFLTDISHDLKTPATVIQGYAEILANGGVPPEKQAPYLHIILSRSVQLSELIHTFFEYTKLYHPNLKPDFQTGDFCEFFREYLANRYEELTAAGCTITVDIPEEEMLLSFDHQLMKRLIDNLIDNSLRHNGGRVDLYAALAQTGGCLVMRIGDRGSGIAPELRETVFSPFVTGNKARTSGEGTGLGLAIAKRIAELHHGTIRLLPEGTDGLSVLFEIKLSLTPQSA